MKNMRKILKILIQNKYIDQALTNAKNALKDAESNQEPNLSTRVHELVDVLRSIKKVKC